MRSKAFILVLGLSLLLSPVAAQEAGDEPAVLDVVSSFYGWARDYSAPDEDGNFRNLVVDRAYHETEYLTENFVATVDQLASEGLHYDPFTCAQDFYTRLDAQVIDVTDEQATVMLITYFGDNPYAHKNTVLLAREGGEWKIDAVICGENFTPEGVVENFYHWYINYRRSGDPLLEGAYREYEFLAPEFVGRLDEIARSDAPDPLFGISERIGAISVDRVSADGSTATVMVHGYIPGKRERHDVLVELHQTEGLWLIADVITGATPEAAALVFYNRYIAYKQYDVDNNLDRIPVLHWGGRWQDYLTVELILSLIDIYIAGDPVMAEPVLCRADIPVRVTAETAEKGDAFARIHIYAEYPGSDAEVLLATAYSDLIHGQWLLSYIGCGES